jgi:hypothetical protein
MRPYSMAVAAFSSFKNLMTKRIKWTLRKVAIVYVNGGPYRASSSLLCLKALSKTAMDATMAGFIYQTHIS